MCYSWLDWSYAFLRGRGKVLFSLHHIKGAHCLHDLALLLLTIAEVVSVCFLHWYFSLLAYSLEEGHHVQPTLKEERVMLPLPESGIEPVFSWPPCDFSDLAVFSLDLTSTLSYHPISLFPLRQNSVYYIPGPPFSLEPAPIRVSCPTAPLKFLSSKVTAAKLNGQFSVSFYLT